VKLIAITGGIGCGKSVVAHMVKIMGYEVYDCDSRAKALMINDPEVKKQLTMAFGEQTYLDDGTLNRQHLSDLAFADSNALACINGIVHPATARDLQRWADSQARQGAKLAFVETALLRTAGLDRVVDSVWHVTAPTDIRIRRVMTRSGLTAQQVKDRIAAQIAEDNLATGEHAIINDNTTALLPQVLQLLIQE
jgi:dephospho-CoA kinase